MYYQNYEDYMKNVLGNRYVPDYMNNQNVGMNYPYTNYSYVPTYTSIPTRKEEVENMREARENFIPTMNMNNMENNVQEVSNNNIMMQNVNSNDNVQEINKLKKMYPDIYKMLMPMVSKTVEENTKPVDETLIEEMTKAVYESIEDDMNVKQVSTTPIQTDSKTKTIQTSSQNQSVQVNNRKIGNPTLRDLIKILIINELLNNCKNRPCNNQNPRPPQRPEPRMNMMNNINDVRPSYPVMNYFSVPYPEDEYIG